MRVLDKEIALKCLKSQEAYNKARGFEVLDLSELKDQNNYSETLYYPGAKGMSLAEIGELIVQQFGQKIGV